MPGKYDSLSKEELIRLVERLERRKKYGLVWDEERVKEKFEQDAAIAVPVLKEVRTKAIKTDPAKPTHILIEGDNYHALTVLNYTHQGKVDVIYIDPPYNTGNRDFKYNDCYVDKEDGYRHSKWLSFMDKRLRLARKLLSDRGVIFISIDDNELFQLKILCDEIFGNNFVACLPTIINLKGNNDQFGFAGTHEYALVYMKNRGIGTIHDFELEEEIFEDEWDQDEHGYFKKGANLKATGVNAPRSKRPNLFFPIFVTQDGNIYVTEDDKLPKNRKGKNDHVLMPLTNGQEMTWRWSKKKIGNEKHNIILVTGSDGVVSVYKKQRPSLGEMPSKKPKSIFYRPEYSSGNGTALIKSMFNGKKVFNNPKPLELIKDFLLTGGDRNSTVLDFMAGSGTTGHAVLDLNQQDGGKRQVILCTNNEENICQNVCYPRLRNVMRGYEDNAGLGGNLKYFKTHFIPKTSNKDDLKTRITRNCTELLCLREGIFNEVKTSDQYRIFEQNGRVMAIYYALDRRDLGKLKKELDKISGERIFYCFTLDAMGLDRNDFEDWDGIELRDIPQKILDIYEGLA